MLDSDGGVLFIMGKGRLRLPHAAGSALSCAQAARAMNSSIREAASGRVFLAAVMTSTVVARPSSA